VFYVGFFGDWGGKVIEGLFHNSYVLYRPIG